MWRDAASFDDIAAMHVTNHGEQILRALALCISSGDHGMLRAMVSAPPWTDNEGGANSPLSLLISLGNSLIEFANDNAVSKSAVEALVAEIAAVVDSVQREQVRELEEAAATDALTGVMNRAAILKRLEIECSRALRHMRPLGVVFMDVDGLKALNDDRGHLAGDELLVKLAAAVNASTRASDAFGRLGGDEFLLVLPETDAEGAATVANKLTSLVADAGVTVTCGAAGTPQSQVDANSLIDAADAAMRAKRA